MSKRQKNHIFCSLFVVTLAAALSGCSSMPVSWQSWMPSSSAASAPAPETTAAPAPAAAPAAPSASADAAPMMTREKASTDCWMKYEKEGRGLSLDQRLPLVEKCTAEKMKTGR